MNAPVSGVGGKHGKRERCRNNHHVWHGWRIPPFRAASVWTFSLHFNAPPQFTGKIRPYEPRCPTRLPSRRQSEYADCKPCHPLCIDSKGAHSISLNIVTLHLFFRLKIFQRRYIGRITTCTYDKDLDSNGYSPTVGCSY